MTQPLLPSQRPLFDIPPDVAYFNAAYMGPLPKAAVAAGEAAAKLKARPWTIAVSDFFGESDRARAAFARLVNAAPDDVALIPAVSYGMAQAAHNIPLKQGQRVLIPAEEFPSNVYPWREAAKAAGAEVTMIARPADDDWTNALLQHIDGRTAAAVLSVCHWTDGGLVDFARVGAALKRQGAALVIDGTQALGAWPCDVKTLDPDFLVCGGYKWLLGPYSFGYLYVAPRWQQGRPIEQNWIARQQSEDFAGLVHYRDDYQPGARRFDVGERSNFALAPVARTSLEFLLDLGIERIQATLGQRNAIIAERAAAELGLGSVAADRRAPHYLGLRFKGPVPADLPARLAEAKVFVSVRGSAMRVTPHVYNTDEDVAHLFAVLKAALGK